MSPSGLRRQLGQLVFLGFDGYSIPVEIRSLAREFDIGGVILFKRNVESPEQVAELAFEAERLVPGTPLWVGVDQEGGRVARLRRPFTEWPPMAALGQADDVKLAARFAEAMAVELRAVGMTIDFAPVLDVLTTRNNPAIGDRALSDDPQVVTRLGSAIIRTFQAGGLAACGKHFPGHGGTTVDSHLELPVVDLPPDRLRQVEFVPFAAAIEASVAAIMVGHLLIPAFDDDLPASLSRRIVTGILRDELGFDNLILTDDLSMKGCSSRFGIPAATTMAIAAGHDGALLCEPHYDGQAAALEALAHALEDETLPYQQVEASVARHARLKARYVRPGEAPVRPGTAWRDVVGCQRHQLISAEMRTYA
jgi:beta-N-acetylhexosaminidase